MYRRRKILTFVLRGSLLAALLNSPAVAQWGTGTPTGTTRFLSGFAKGLVQSTETLEIDGTLIVPVVASLPAVAVANQGAFVYLSTDSTLYVQEATAWVPAPGSKGDQGDQGLQGDTGPGFTWRASWVPSTGYAVRNVLRYNDNIYVCTQAHSSNSLRLPGTSGGASYWDLMLPKGSKGDQGTRDCKAFKGCPDPKVIRDCRATPAPDLPGASAGSRAPDTQYGTSFDTTTTSMSVRKRTARIRYDCPARRAALYTGT